MNDILEEEIKVDMTPMIDVVFLLLVFFMVTTTLMKQEADLSLQLPSDTPPVDTDELPEKHIIDVMPDGEVLLNGGPTGDPIYGIELKNLGASLSRLKATSDRMGKKTIVTIHAAPFSPHVQSIKVLDACAFAGVKFVSFHAQ